MTKPRSWTVTRDWISRPGAQRRWDRAYQVVLHMAAKRPKEIAIDTAARLTPKEIAIDTAARLTPKEIAIDTAARLTPKEIAIDTAARLTPKESHHASRSGLCPCFNPAPSPGKHH